MKLSLIGMSGVGKSYWAKQLAAAGYTHLDCDLAIAEHLGELIAPRDGEQPVHAVGRWMGMPWSEGFEQREAKYLALEADATQQAINDAAEHPDEPAVIDTTGSLIYTGDALLERLKRSTRVVYFDVPIEVRQQMVELYLGEPKPVLWQGMYQPEPGQSQEQSLERCYANLLADRDRRYRALADVVLDYQALREPECDVERLLRMIGS